jgi:hypothetical protein
MGHTDEDGGDDNDNWLDLDDGRDSGDNCTQPYPRNVEDFWRDIVPLLGSQVEVDTEVPGGVAAALGLLDGWWSDGGAADSGEGSGLFGSFTFDRGSDDVADLEW